MRSFSDLANMGPVDRLWYWIHECHMIWVKRKLGRPKPWTRDPILQQYRFCNVFRGGTPSLVRLGTTGGPPTRLTQTCGLRWQWHG